MMRCASDVQQCAVAPLLGGRKRLTLLEERRCHDCGTATLVSWDAGVGARAPGTPVWLSPCRTWEAPLTGRAEASSGLSIFGTCVPCQAGS